MANKKILFVVNRFYPEVGGAETNTYFQATLLAKNNDVTVITPKRTNDVEQEEIDGIKILRVSDLFNREKYYPNLRAKTLCSKVFTEILFGSYDLVHCFPALSHNAMLARLACFLRFIPCVLSCFDFLDYKTFIDSEGNIDQDILNKVKVSKIRRFFLKTFSHIFCISYKEIDFIKKINKKVNFSPVPVLLDEYKKSPENPRSKYGIEEGDFVFLVLGRLSRLKGQDIAVEAFKNVQEKIPNSKIVIVGRDDYEGKFTYQVKNYVYNNRLMDKVVFTGAVSRGEVLGWLKFCDIHVVPVRFMNSGAVVVETWASKRTVIQSDVVDPNLVVEGQNGYLFESANTRELAEKMHQSFLDRDKFLDMSTKGLELVEEKFNYKYLINLYEQTYSDVCRS